MNREGCLWMDLCLGRFGVENEGIDIIMVMNVVSIDLKDWRYLIIS